MKALHTMVLAIFIAMVATHDGWAQSYAFMVISSKGMTEKKTGDNWQPIKIGDRLKTTDEVKIPGNAYLGLQHSSGKPLEIRDPGSYPVAELASKVGKGSSPLNKYADFKVLFATTHKVSSAKKPKAVPVTVIPVESVTSNRSPLTQT